DRGLYDAKRQLAIDYVAESRLRPLRGDLKKCLSWRDCDCAAQLRQVDAGTRPEHFAIRQDNGGLFPREWNKNTKRRTARRLQCHGQAVDWPPGELDDQSAGRHLARRAGLEAAPGFPSRQIVEEDFACEHGCHGAPNTRILRDQRQEPLLDLNVCLRIPPRKFEQSNFVQRIVQRLPPAAGPPVEEFTCPRLSHLPPRLANRGYDG